MARVRTSARFLRLSAGAGVHRFRLLLVVLMMWLATSCASPSVDIEVSYCGIRSGPFDFPLAELKIVNQSGTVARVLLNVGFYQNDIQFDTGGLVTVVGAKDTLSTSAKTFKDAPDPTAPFTCEVLEVKTSAA